MPPTAPANRERLAEFMEERRSELRLRWQDVADAGGISIRALQAVRHGTSEIRPLTRAGIEAGLQWAHGSLQMIEEGRDPVPLPSTAPPAPRPLVLTPPGPGDPLPAPPPGFLDEAGIARARPYAEAIWQQAAALRHSGTADPGGAQMFGEGAEDAATWDDYRRRGLPLDRRAWFFGALIAHSSPSEDRGRGTGLARSHPRIRGERHDSPADTSGRFTAIARL